MSKKADVECLAEALRLIDGIARQFLPVVVSLCDHSGNMVKPWVEAGCIAVLVDPRHGQITFDGRILRLPFTVGQVMFIGAKLRHLAVFAVGFPPCTDLTVSGARWWASKAQKNPAFQAEALNVVHQCSALLHSLGCPWMVENPIGALSRMWRKPDYLFHPHEYAGHCEADNYNKRTCLWTGGGFRMPIACPSRSGNQPDNRIHRGPRGPDPAAFRSVTPMGFAIATHLENRT
jgi:hypothetical protein